MREPDLMAAFMSAIMRMMVQIWPWGYYRVGLLLDCLPTITEQVHVKATNRGKVDDHLGCL